LYEKNYTGANPGNRFRRRATVFEAMDLGAALTPQLVLGKTWWESIGRSAWKLLKFRSFISLKSCLPRSNV
jgi:hypothetical protein